MTAAAEPGARRPWHALSPAEALAALGVAASGLTGPEAAERRAAAGPNTLPRPRRAGPLAVFLRQFRDPLIVILLGAAAVAALIGDVGDAGFIGAVLVLNALIGGWQEWQAETSAGALQRLLTVRALVERDGQRRELDSAELVPGDVVHLEPGMAVPADLRLLSAQELRADESLLTGESEPVAKRAEAAVPEGAPAAERATMLHAGTTVLAGRGHGVVCATGAQTEIGRIAEGLARPDAAAAPPLVLRLRALSRGIAVATIGAVALLGLVLALRGEPPAEVLLLAVALAVSAIPEGLPVAITVALAVACRRMARRQVIVRRLPAVEGLGACTLIATDKTGTLTQNRLTVGRLWWPGLPAPVDPASPMAGEAARALAVTGAFCNEARLHRGADGAVEASGDTVDAAFLLLAAGLGLDRAALLADRPEVGAIPYESERRFAAGFHRDGARTVAHAKGAAETILAMCDGVDPAAVRAAETSLAEAGYRVLALAAGPVDHEAARRGDPAALRGLRLLGLAGLIDPVRPEVPEAIRRCRAAGVDIRMVTGDHPATGLAIARTLGLAGPEDRAVTGAALTAATEPGARAAMLHDARVFARVEPAQKMAIVAALQEAGHFVAVTGDGVNDAPALRAAHIGVAMGRGGTDVARGAADLILADDNFASLVAGIEEGRVAYATVRKLVWLLLSTGFAEILLVALAVLAGLPLPLTAVQLLWLNLVTNGIQDVALGFERGGPGVLRRRPRPPEEPILDRRMVSQVLLTGLVMGGVSFAAFWWLVEVAGVGVEAARNQVLLLLVLFENLHVFNVRSETRSVLRVPLAANPQVVAAALGAQALHIMAMHLPGLDAVLGLAPVDAATWVALLALAASVVVVSEAMKALRRRG